MAKKETKKQAPKQGAQVNQVENESESKSKAGLWVERNANLISWILIGIILVVFGCIALRQYVFAPKAAEAQNENAKCEAYFMAGDWEKALNGDEAECIGFEQVANQYKHYQPGRLAALYAGICYYELGDYESAAPYLKRFKAQDLNVSPAAAQLLGDTYVELEDYHHALKAYRAAAKTGNELIAPMSLKKAGLVYLKLEDKDAAKAVFTAIKNNYPTSMEAQDIDKYISIAE
mgnify:FL=1